MLLDRREIHKVLYTKESLMKRSKQNWLVASIKSWRSEHKIAPRKLYFEDMLYKHARKYFVEEDC